jgi:hypothetical protein
VSSTTDSMMWHDDGHSITLQLQKSDLKILAVNCPHKDAEDKPCSHPDAPCVIEWFLMRYGLECNVGVCAPSGELGISWTFVGSNHQELEACQVWIIPRDDEAFAAWMVTQQ